MQYGLKYSGSGGGERERERESERSLNAASKYASGTFSTCIFSTTILKLGTVHGAELPKWQVRKALRKRCILTILRGYSKFRSYSRDYVVLYIHDTYR